MSKITYKEILEIQHNAIFTALKTSELIVGALKRLPAEFLLEPRFEQSAYGTIRTEITAEKRIEELEKDIVVLKARLEIINEEINANNQTANTKETGGIQEGKEKEIPPTEKS